MRLLCFKTSSESSFILVSCAVTVNPFRAGFVDVVFHLLRVKLFHRLLVLFRDVAAVQHFARGADFGRKDQRAPRNNNKECKNAYANFHSYSYLKIRLRVSFVLQLCLCGSGSSGMVTVTFPFETHQSALCIGKLAHPPRRTTVRTYRMFLLKGRASKRFSWEGRLCDRRDPFLGSCRRVRVRFSPDLFLHHTWYKC